MSGTLTPSGNFYTVAGTGLGSGTLYSAGCGVEGSYATVQDLAELSLSENVVFDFSQQMLRRQLVRASRQADSLICHRFRTPLALYSEAWVGWVCDIAAYFAMDVNGWKPGDDGRDQEARFVRKYKTAMAMIREAQDYMLTPDHRLLGTESPSPATPVSLPNRQWLSLRRLGTT